MKKNPIDFVKHVLIAISRIEETISAISWNDFSTDYHVQDVVIRELEIIGEACNHMEHVFHADYPQIPWAQIISTRNNLIHEYWEVDLDEVWNTVHRDIPELKKVLLMIISEQSVT